MFSSSKPAEVATAGQSKNARAPSVSSERARAIQSYASDPKYKKYTQQVEKCLNSFDNVQEWADCIAFLKQLLKTFQSYMQFKEIPRKLIVAKRLSQCLNPALPTGVHQRALDVYAHIMAVLGSEGLKQDLPLWSSGLFPFFEYAATSVKPTLLNLYDTHYLPLQSGLRPIMKSFILALLPGLEEEGSEFFDQVISLLDRLSGTVSPSFFLQNIWLVMLTTPAARGTALNFLSRRLPRLKPDEAITHIVGRDVGLMIRAFAAAMEDENLLVRRSALDLLVQSLRMDSVTVKEAHADDRAILMRAASSVVLRRDLSLNRRLYTWLLGPDEHAEAQVKYLCAHALELLRSTLRDEMFSPSMDFSESRPFKIFISLMDKWEIGASLTDVLVYDAFKAIKKSAESADSGEDIMMTANTLYEAVEPSALWKHLCSAVFAELSGDGIRTEGIHLARFILKTFHHDEEVKTAHLPVVLSAVACVLSNQVRKQLPAPPTAAAQEALLLLEELLTHIPPAALRKRLDIAGERSAQSPYDFACTFYGLPSTMELIEPHTSSGLGFVDTFEDTTRISLTLATNMPGMDNVVSQQVFEQTLSLLAGLVRRLDDKKGDTLTVSWDPSHWLSSMLLCLDHETLQFSTVDRIITIASTLEHTDVITPNVAINNRAVLQKMIRALWRYLQPNCALYHVRVVNLIWSLESTTSRSHVESVIAQTLTSPSSRNVQDAHEAFGVFWRLTDDSRLPGTRLKVPMLIVLDTLKSDDPGLRRIGETWMRCSLKSYLRVLDPILFDLLDPTIRRTASIIKLNGRELHGFVYERPIDQQFIHHLLELLLAIIYFGGQGFVKTTRHVPIRRSLLGDLIERAEPIISSRVDATYLDVIVEVMLRFLMSEPPPGALATMGPFNTSIQAVALDILQSLVARGDIDDIALQTLEASVIGKLYFSVHNKQLDLQNKLLHLLHSVISALTDHHLPDRSRDASLQDNTHAYTTNPLLIHTLIDAITLLHNRPVLQHWLDFVLTTLPQFQHTLQTALGPLNDCVCRQLRSSLLEIQQSSTQDIGDADCSINDAELLLFLSALERLVLLHLSSTAPAEQLEDDSFISEKSGVESVGLFGYVSGVFGSDQTTAPVTEQLSARSPGYHALDEAVRVLYAIWAGLVWTNPATWSPRCDGLSLIFNRTRTRCRRVLEHLFRVHSSEVLESIVECWNREHKDDINNIAAFELVDVLTSSAQTVVHMICESISCRTSTAAEKNRKQAINPNLTDAMLFSFLEQYLARLEGPVAIQVWGRYLQLVKDVVGNPRDTKLQTLPTLRCLTVLANKLSLTTAVDDRRVRKDLQDNFVKLLDASVNMAGRDQGTWIRRMNKDSLVANGRNSPAPGRDSPLLRVASETNLLEKSNLQDSVASISSAAAPDIISQIIDFIATAILPNLRKFLTDNDKIVTACSNITYYILSPAMKGKARPLDVDDVVIKMLSEMTRIQAALKVWRSPVMEALSDNRVFNSTPEAGELWKTVVGTMIDVDKTSFMELLGKVYTAPSANIFVNREYEMLLQSLNLRRLSYVLLTGEKNHFLTQLPSVQEKLVEIFRNVTSPVVQSEVYLCIRVLVCRLSPHNLTSFWPVVLTELYRLLEQTKLNIPADGSEELPLILAACKCLDLLLTTQTQEFQIHQWMFITDTVDAVYRPDDWTADGLIDQLAEIAAELPAPDKQSNPPPPAATPGTAALDSRTMRRPALNSLRQIDSIRDLVPFFSSVSIATYESVYASAGNVDWAAVERGLLDDMFDGR